MDAGKDTKRVWGPEGTPISLTLLPRKSVRSTPDAVLYKLGWCVNLLLCSLCAAVMLSCSVGIGLPFEIELVASASLPPSAVWNLAGTRGHSPRVFRTGTVIRSRLFRCFGATPLFQSNVPREAHGKRLELRVATRIRVYALPSWVLSSLVDEVTVFGRLRFCSVLRK